MNIKQFSFPKEQYIQEEHKKVQIYLHHTAGSPSGEDVFRYWSTNKERIATCVCISGYGDNDGQIVQGFPSKHWAFHLGLKESTFQKAGLKYKSLDKISIGIEICNWGQLTLKNGKFYNYVNTEVSPEQVIRVKYKGHEFFQNYTDKQIDSVRSLLVLWGNEYGIPLKYNEDIFDITPRALSGKAGVFTHNSVRTDKVDIYPHPKMIEMLRSL